MTTGLDPFDRSTWEPVEERYFQMIDAAIRSREDKPLSNGKPAHAAYLIHKILTHAEQAVRIFSGSLMRRHGETEVYGARPIIEAAAAFLRKRDTRLVVVPENDLDVDAGRPLDSHPLIAHIQQLKDNGRLAGSLEVRRASKDLLGELAQKGILNHWMVMDESACRVEPDSEKASAVANFGDAELASNLTGVFDERLCENSARPIGRHA